MRAVEHVVREFLERPTNQRKIVINLGCGYDPLPFHWLAREPRLCRNVQFIDVDYKALMLTKTEIIEATPRMRDLLTPQALPADGYTILNATEYLAIGCDLRDIAGLPSEVVDRQSAQVDIVSRATYSSQAFRTAVAQALGKAA